MKPAIARYPDEAKALNSLESFPGASGSSGYVRVNPYNLLPRPRPPAGGGIRKYPDASGRVSPAILINLNFP